MSPKIRLRSGDDVSRFLSDADPALGAVIDRLGGVEFAPPEGRFAMLVRGVVGQQLSQASASAIYKRLAAATELTPEGVAQAGGQVLRAAGLSARKADYVRGMAEAILRGDVDLDTLDGLDDSEVVEQLTRLRGIGPWSAHMFSIIALGRPDVLPVGDLGVRRSAGRMLGLDRDATVDELESRAELWRPHRSAASLYLMTDVAGPARASAGRR